MATVDKSPGDGDQRIHRRLRAMLAIGAVTCCGLAASVVLLVIPGAAPAVPTVVVHQGNLVIVDPLAVATHRGGFSAVGLTIENLGPTPVVLRKVASPVATSAMLAFDVAGCDPRSDGSSMHQIPSIEIDPHQSLRLDAHQYGVMLMRLRAGISAGSTVPVGLTFTQSQGQAALVQLRVPVEDGQNPSMPSGMHM